MNSVSVNAKDLQAGKKLTLVKVDKKDRRKSPDQQQNL